MERLKHILISQEGRRIEINVQLDGGYAGAAFYVGEPAYSVVSQLRIIADYLERGVIDRGKDERVEIDDLVRKHSNCHRGIE